MENATGWTIYPDDNIHQDFSEMTVDLRNIVVHRVGILRSHEGGYEGGYSVCSGAQNVQ